MSKTYQKDVLVSGINDTPENVAKALMNPRKRNIVKSKRSIKRKKVKSRNK